MKSNPNKRHPAWDYHREATYLLTLNLAQREKALLGKLVLDKSSPLPQAHIDCTDIGRAVSDCWHAIPRLHPEVRLLGCQIMPDHFHGILWITRPTEKPLGEIVRRFKIECTRKYREIIHDPTASGFWEAGFHDRILSTAAAVEHAKTYLKENPLHLAIKRQSQTFFTLHRRVKIPLPLFPDEPLFEAAFQLLGNRALLSSSHFHPLLVSRKDFRFKPGISTGSPREIERMTPAFEQKKRAMIEAAEKGATIVTSALSHGEQALCRLAVDCGYPIIQLRNQCLSPLYKPGGKLFHLCAGGNYLLLAPIAWRHTPYRRPLTRVDALVLNRIIRAICNADTEPEACPGFEAQRIDKALRWALT